MDHCPFCGSNIESYILPPHVLRAIFSITARSSDCHHLSAHLYLSDSPPVPSRTLLLMTQLPAPIDLDDVLQQIRDSLLLHPTRDAVVKIVIESDAGEELHILKVHSRSSSDVLLQAAGPTLMRAQPPAAPSSLRADKSAGSMSNGLEEQPRAEEHGLLQQCREQQRRIAELELHLQQAKDELRQRAPSPTSSSTICPPQPISPAHSTEDDNSSSSDSPCSSSSGEMSDDGDRAPDDIVAMSDDGDDGSLSSSIEADSSHDPPVSGDSTAVRRSERSKTNVNRWTPPPQQKATHRAADPLPSLKRRKTQRHRRSYDDDGDHCVASIEMTVEVDSMNAPPASKADDEDAAEVAALIAKLRDGHGKRQTIALDSLSRESILSLHQRVLVEDNDNIPSVSGQITALIGTSTSLKMVGYYLRATLAHRLKRTSHQAYRRLARDKLSIKSPADIAAYPALYELVQHHYPNLASWGIEVWLENPIFLADITWTEWKRYLTKQGRPIIDAALRQFNAALAPFSDWMQLGWVEVYDDDKLGGQGVRALRDIHMPKGKAKDAQRDLAASVSVVAADMHCVGPEYVLDKDAAGEGDPTYHLQLDGRRVFDARHHWVGKINHLPDRVCNLRLTSTSKLVQTKPIAAGDALTFDYGVDYWVYQLSGQELSTWSAGSSVSSSRGMVDLFRRMHNGVLDYTDLLRRDWMQHRPTKWTQLDKEGWMANLAEYLEELKL